MPYDRQRMVAQARSWLGRREADGSFREIIDVYNSCRPLPRGYAVAYTDAWCAVFVSACAAAAGYTEIIPGECSCSNMIALFQGMGRWKEDDGYVPKPGDIIFYDWQDSGAGDNRGEPDHVGIVEACDGRYITVIEGNISDSVGRRTISVNGRYIRGYGIPDYDAKAPGSAETQENPAFSPEPLPAVLRRGSVGYHVRAMQILLAGHGYPPGPLGDDGQFGNDTERALKEFQAASGIESDGICGAETWAWLLGSQCLKEVILSFRHFA